MRKALITITLALFLLLSMAYAMPITTCQTLNQAGTTYVLQNDINAQNTCFTIDADDVTLDLNGYTVERVGNSFPNWGVNSIGNNNVTLKNGYFSNFFYTISILDSQSGEMTNITINNPQQPSAQVITLEQTSNYQINSITFETVDRAMSLFNSTNITINNTTINNSTEVAYIENVENISIINFISHGSDRGISLYDNKFVYLENVTLENTQKYGFLPGVSSIDYCSNNFINVKTNNHQVEWINAPNQIFDSDIGEAIVCGTQNITFQDIDITQGLFIFNAENIEVKNANINNTYFPLLAHSSNNLIIEDTTITHAEIYFPLINVTNATIINNDIQDNQQFGLFIENSEDIFVSGNTISYNFRGLLIKDSFNVIIDNNIFEQNDLNFGMVDNNNILFYNNYIFGIWSIGNNNTNTSWNIPAQSGTNIVGGSMIGGNFWGEPQGTGFSQTCTDANTDGFCDTPYVIDASQGAIDNLPLALPAIASFIRGDANRDGMLNIVDAITIISFVNNQSPITCEDAADVNDNGVLNVADAIYLLEYLFNSGPTPLAPFPTASSDQTPDTLGCVL